MLSTSLLLSNAIYGVAPVVFPAGLAAIQAAPAAGAALLGNPIVQGIGARLAAALGGKLLGGLMGSPEDEAFKQQLAELQRLQPGYLQLLQQQAAGQPTAVTRAIQSQVQQQGRGQQQALATSAARMGQGGTAVARAQQARQFAAENQALTQLLGQAQMGAQAQIGALTGRATQQQALLAQQEASDISELTRFITMGAFDQEIKDKLQMLIGAVEGVGAGETANIIPQAGDVTPAPGITQPAPALGAATDVERATVTSTVGGQLAIPAAAPTQRMGQAGLQPFPTSPIPPPISQIAPAGQVRQVQPMPVTPGMQPVPGLQDVPRPQAPIVRQQPTPRTKAAQAMTRGVMVADTGSISPKVAREQAVRQDETLLPPQPQQMRIYSDINKIFNAYLSGDISILEVNAQLEGVRRSYPGTYLDFTNRTIDDVFGAPSQEVGQ